MILDLSWDQLDRSFRREFIRSDYSRADLSREVGLSHGVKVDFGQDIDYVLNYLYFTGA